MFLPNRHRLWWRLVLMLGAVGLFVLGYLWGNQYQRSMAGPPEIAGVLLRAPAPLPAFRLADAKGRVVDQNALTDGWTLLTFGDLGGASGQLGVQRLIDVYNRVSDQPDLYRDLQLWMVTGDLAPQVARDYSRLSPALRVLDGGAVPGGGADEPLGKALGVEGQGPSPVFILGPGGRLLAILPAEEDGARMAADLKAIHAHQDFFLSEQP